MLEISRDGSRIAYVANNQIFTRSMSDAATQPIPGTDAARPRGSVTFALSPDGRFIALATDGVLKKLPVQGGTPLIICPFDDPTPGSMSWGPTDILFVTAGGIMRVSPDGGTPERIVAIDNADEMIRSPQLLPDGRTVLFTVAKRNDEVRWANAEIAVQSTTGPRRTIVRGAGDAQYVASGHIVYTRDGGLMAAPFDAARQQLLGPAVPVLEGVGDRSR